MLESARNTTQKKLAAAALAGLLSAGAFTAAGQAAEAQAQGEGEVVNREVVVNEDRDYTGLWGLLGLLGLAGLAGLRRKKDDNVEVRRVEGGERGSTSGARNVTSADGEDGVRRGRVPDSEVVSSTGGRGVDGDKVDVNRADAGGGAGVRRDTVSDSEVVASTEGGGIDDDKVNVRRKR